MILSDIRDFLRELDNKFPSENNGNHAICLSEEGAGLQIGVVTKDYRFPLYFEEDDLVKDISVIKEEIFSVIQETINQQEVLKSGI